MFKSARLKLTVFYILIIALISILFSIAFYKSSTRELDRVEFRLQHPQPLVIIPSEEVRVRINTSISSIEEAKERIALNLVIINFIILFGSAVASYFLAGRTLKPIQEMVDDQNRFISDASHELRTPLTALKTGIEVNLRDKSLSLKQAKDLISNNLEEVNTLQILTDNLIRLTQYQKTDNGRILENVSSKEIMTEAIKRVALLAKQKNIKITQHIQDFNTKADKQALIEVMVILLDNAIKYSPEKTKIELSSQKIDHSAEIKVTDQGMGIDESDLPHIFDRFYRADKSRTKSEVSGYGLGLSIAKQIITRHNGTIKVQRQSHGTTFVVTVPLLNLP